MDIVRKSQDRKLDKKTLIVIAIVGVLILGFFAYSNTSITARSFNRTALTIAEVTKGDMAVKVFGTGTMVPKEVRWVASNVPGRIDRILVKPGAVVEKGQVLLELDNPEILRSAEETTWEIEAAEAEHTALVVSLESDLLNQKGSIQTVQLDLESAILQRDAEAILVEQGNATISLLEHNRTKLKARQLQNSLEVETMRLQGLLSNKEAQINASLARLNKLRNTQKHAQEQVANLSVKALESGVVQEVPVELGQRLIVGTNVVKMADQSQLIAELQIAERLINEVLVGQMVIIDTRKSEVEGEVTRIDPAVVNGTVLVEVAFTESLPLEARPDLSISGDIWVADLRDTLHVSRPILAQSNQSGVIFKLDESENIASRIPIKFGKGSSNQIEIISGLNVGDRVIVSDHSSYAHLDKISIN